jgi:hypothetical protein
MQPTPPKLLEFEKVNELAPAFDGDYGWMTMMELNVVDPNGYRFDIIEDATFEDGTVFVLVEKSKCR